MKKFILGLVLFLVPAMLSASEVYDGARMFSDSTKASVVEKLNKLEADSGVETIVETFPQSARSSFNGDSDKNHFFQDWLINAAKSRGARGVYVLICKSPGRVQVDFSKSLFERGIPISNTSFVRDAALNRLKAKDANGALVAIADTVDSMFAPKLEAAASKPLVIPVPVFTEHKPVVVPVVPDPVPPVPQPAPVILPGEEESNFLFYVVVIGLGAAGIGFVAWIIWLVVRKDETSSSGVSLQSDSLSYNIPTTKCQACGAQTNQNPCAFCKAEVDWKKKTTKEILSSSSPTKVVNVTHVHNDGGVDPLLAGVVGYELGRSQSSHVPSSPAPPPVERRRESSSSYSSDDTPSYSSRSSSDDSSSSFFGGSGGDWGSSSSDSGFGGGGDFGGGSGGDF